MERDRANSQGEITLRVEVVRELESLLREASHSAQLSAELRNQLKSAANSLGRELREVPRSQLIRLPGQMWLLVLRCLAFFLRHRQELKQLVDILLGGK